MEFSEYLNNRADAVNKSQELVTFYVATWHFIFQQCRLHRLADTANYNKRGRAAHSSQEIKIKQELLLTEEQITASIIIPHVIINIVVNFTILFLLLYQALCRMPSTILFFAIFDRCCC